MILKSWLKKHNNIISSLCTVPVLYNSVVPILICTVFVLATLTSRLLPESCQKVLFSATYSDLVMKFAQRVIPDPIIIRLKRNEESLTNIKQFYVDCKSKEDKFSALSNLYGVVSIGQAMIFCHVSCIVKNACSNNVAGFILGKKQKPRWLI